MIQEILDEVLDTSLQPDVNPRYTLKDNVGNVINDNVQIELKTPVVTEGTPLNKATFVNLQGDLYTQDRYNVAQVVDGVLIVDLPLTSYEVGKVIKLQSPQTLTNPYININQRGNKLINGKIVANEKISLVYNGQSFDRLFEIPSGIICMWSGTIDTIPNGWNLCDGSNNTPDLRDRFIVGAGNTYNVGDTGGSNTVTLTIEEMPSHSHGYTAPSGSYYNGEYLESRGSIDTASSTTGKTGGGQPHENRPPYYALAYIMKL